MTGIYARQSVDKKDSISIETQIELCRRVASNPNDCRVYTDKGFSGKNTNRPEFRQLMADIESGEVDRVVIYRLDRISRSISDFAAIMNTLEEHHASFVSITENFDTGTPMGRAMMYIVAVFAQLERETIAERIRDNYYSRGKLGVWLGGPAPFGFSLCKTALHGKTVSTLQPSGELSTVIRLFEQYADSSDSLGGLAATLRADCGNRYGGWNNSRLARILHNPIYVRADADIYRYYKEQGCIMVNELEEFDGTRGLIIYGKRDKNLSKYQNLNEQVAVLSLSEGHIPSEVFLTCQHKMAKNRQVKNSGKGKHTWMSGLMKCGNCGYALTVKSYAGRKYLYCTGHQQLHLCDGTGDAPLLLEPTEQVVDRLVCKYLEEVDRSEPLPTANGSEAENQLKISLQKINEQIERLIDALAESNGVTVTYLNRKIAELDMQKQELLRQLEKNHLQPSKKEIPTPKEWREADQTQKHNLAQQVIHKIRIRNTDIHVEWNY